MSRSPAPEEATALRCGALALEGRISAAPGAPFGAVVCHPHPQYGGDMENPVVAATVAALRAAGAATLRFNFRGVGASEGRYGGGAAEVEDARAAVSALRERAPEAAIALGGYSFGAMVALVAGCADPDVARSFAIALPVTMFDAEALRSSARPKLFVLGDRDEYCPGAALDELVGRLAGANSVVRLSGADHFLMGFEERVGSEVARFVTQPAGS